MRDQAGRTELQNEGAAKDAGKKEPCTARILAGSREAIEKNREDDAIQIVFVEESEEEEGNCVFAWQSAERICRRILILARERQKRGAGLMKQVHSRWSLILTAGSRVTLLPFGTTFAQI